MTTYETRGMGEGEPGLQALFAELVQALFAELEPGRDTGPNAGLAIEFESGVKLSLVWGWGTYSAPDTVEVAVVGKDGEWLTPDVARAAFEEDIGDVVDGYCDAERVHAYFLTAQAWKEGA